MYRTRHILLILTLMSVCQITFAKFLPPTLAPVDRLIQNAAAYAEEHPEDAHAWYTLGRIHYLAFVTRSVETFIPDNPPPPKPAAEWLAQSYVRQARNREATRRALEQSGYASAADIPSDTRQEFYKLVGKVYEELAEQNWRPPQISLEQTIAHVDEAARHLATAISMDSENGLYHLGLASLYEQYVEFLQQNDVGVVPASIRQVILETARQSYYTAYSFAIRQDLKNKYMPIRGLGSLVGYEAGRAYVRLTEADPLAVKTEKKKLAAVRKDVKTLEGLKVAAITPIVFSHERGKSLSDLLAEDLTVRFDLDGDGAVEEWPWVKPDTAILVWDPTGRGRITSGRQLFGSVTWWLFFADGYRALDALDDNRDGQLTGAELEGIGVWIDANSNGASDEGEVRDANSAGIGAIAARSSGVVDGVPGCMHGIAFTDGTACATYDWTTVPR